MPHTLQLILREKIIAKIDEYLNLPINNTWEEVFDLSISRGSTGWQLYGSRKPDNDAYVLKYCYLIQYDDTDETCKFVEESVDGFINNHEKLKLISARNSDCILFESTQFSKNKIEEKNNEKKKLSMKGIKRYNYSMGVNLNIRNQQQLDIRITNNTGSDAKLTRISFDFRKASTNANPTDFQILYLATGDSELRKGSSFAAGAEMVNLAGVGSDTISGGVESFSESVGGNIDGTAYRHSCDRPVYLHCITDSLDGFGKDYGNSGV